MTVDHDRGPGRALTLPIPITEVCLTTGLDTAVTGGAFIPPMLAFSGVVCPPSSETCSGTWDLPEYFGGRNVTVRCAAAKLGPRPGPDQPTIGSLQFSPVAPDMGITAEVFCCRRLFAALKNAVSFSGGSGTGLKLLLDLSQETDDLLTQGRAVMHLPVTRIMVKSVRSFRHRMALAAGNDIQPARSEPAWPEVSFG